MASKTAGTDEAAPTRRIAFERFPVRRVILVVLSILIVVGVTLGSWATLSESGTEALSGAQWRSLVIIGIANGSVYGLIALGYTLVYGILTMINFAHGEVFMAGAFSSVFVARVLDEHGLLDSNPILSIVILLLVGMAVSTFIAVLLERVAYRPLRGAPRLVPLITAIGASLFLQNTFRGFFGAQARNYPKVGALSGRWTILGIPFQRTQVLVIVSAAVVMAALYWFIGKTRTGRSMRAVSEDKEIASLMGVNVDRVIVTTFAIGGMLAGVAGILFALTFESVNPFMGFLPGIKAFTAAVLGGIGSITGALLGGLTLGLLEAVGPSLFLRGADIPGPNQLQPVIAFTILVLVLIFRPGGLLGSGEAEKV